MLVAGGLAVVQELNTGDPQRIGPYRLLGRLGAGGMGRVFLGRSAGGRLVAVKVIRPELADDPEFRARFGREVAAAKKVSGLFTAPVVDADLDGPMPWLATAYVAGPSLADALTGHGPLPAASVLALAAGLAEGLSAIHAAGVVHRDLKPSNVLLAGDGPRVIDFGISQAAEASALTNTDLVVGSPGFMSPEQAEGREVGPPSDVFSLGAVLTFAATGEGPFGAGSTAALVYRAVHGPPGLDHVPAQVRPLIRRCLAKDACRRPATAELLAELGGADLAVDWLPAPVILRFPQPSAPEDAPGGPTTVTAARLNQPQQPPGQPQQAPGQPQQAPGQPHRAPGQPQPGGAGHKPQRRGRRSLALAWLTAAFIAASAAGAVALAGATRESAATQHQPPVQAITTSPAVSAPAAEKAPAAQPSAEAGVPQPSAKPLVPPSTSSPAARSNQGQGPTPGASSQPSAQRTTAAPPTPAPPPASGDVPPSTDPGQTPVPAGATTLGDVDLSRYCQQAGMYAVLRFPDTSGWRCSPSPVAASGNRLGDQNINVLQACVQQYGTGAASHYRDYSDPNSWFCWR